MYKTIVDKTTGQVHYFGENVECMAQYISNTIEILTDQVLTEKNNNRQHYVYDFKTKTFSYFIPE